MARQDILGGVCIGGRGGRRCIEAALGAAGFVWCVCATGC